MRGEARGLGRAVEVVAPDGVRLAVTAVGDPGPPAAVVAHGVGSSARFVADAFGAPLAAAGLRLVTYDLRGHGDSDPVRDPARHALAHHVADLAAVVEAFPARVVGGVSLGAHAAAALAVRDAAAAPAAPRPAPELLLAIPAWTGRATPGAGPHAAVAAAVRRDGVAAVLDRAVADTPGWLGALLARDWARCDEASLAAALVALDGGAAPSLGDLAAVGAPAGVVGWPHDPGHPFDVAAAWARALPRGALAVTTVEEVGADPSVLGRAAVDALSRSRSSAGRGAGGAPRG